MKCKKCGFDNKDGALYCSQCGSKIESSKIENIKKNRNSFIKNPLLSLL